MLETLLALLTAHLIADFPLQSDWLIRRKRSPLILIVHIVIIIAATIILLGAAPVRLMIILVATHFLMDAVKVYLLPDRLWAFLLDQAVHLTVILGLSIAYPNSLADGLWGSLSPEYLKIYLLALCLMSGGILNFQVGSIVIRKAVSSFTDQIDDSIQGLEKGGAFIGVLERALVMLLVLMGEPTGVGFLITAKSILRFGDVKETNQRKMTEYIIIGTFLSFGWGLAASVITKAAMDHWV